MCSSLNLENTRTSQPLRSLNTRTHFIAAGKPTSTGAVDLRQPNRLLRFLSRGLRPGYTATCLEILPRLSATAAVAAVLIPGWSRPAEAGVAVRIGQNFTGSTDSYAWAPCPSGAVSADYFVEFNIDTFAVYSRATGSSVRSNVAWRDFWSQAGITLPSTYGNNTPRVVFDPTVQRWFVAEDTGDNNYPTNTSHFLLAISATADPTGAWNGVSIPDDPGGNNYSGWVNIGLDAQGVYLSSVVASSCRRMHLIVASQDRFAVHSSHHYQPHLVRCPGCDHLWL